jgi:hypothetical protein
VPRVARKDLPPLGRLLAEDDGSRVQCHLCGRWWALLGMHVSRGHGMTPDEYREQFGLNRTTGLVAPALARRLAEVHGARLAVGRREGFDALTPEQLDRSRRRPHRPEGRGRQSEAARLRHARRPGKPRPEPLSNEAVRRLALAKIAELRRDPAWLAAWRAKIREVRRTLTDDQLREIVALRGSVSQAEIVRRYRVTDRTVRRIWRGELRPQS